MPNRTEDARNSSEGSTADGGFRDPDVGHPPTAEDRQDPRSERSRSPKAAREEKVRAGDSDTKQKNRNGHAPRGFRGVAQKIGKMLPDYYTAAFHDPRAWKTFIRCMIAVFATLVLLLCQTSLNAIGSATFFALIMSQMLPPNMAISIFTMAFVMILFGICLGWAWGAAAMAAAVRGRSQVLFQEQLKRFQTAHANDVNPDAEYRASIFQGDFLDPVASTIFGVFLFVGAYFFGFIRAKKPRLTIACIFALIILDLMCTFGPLFPFVQYTLANNLVIPACAYVAVALACNILIFPQSLNSIVMDGTVKSGLGPTLSILSLQDEVLRTSPADHEKWGELAKKAQGLRAAIVGGIAGLEGQLGMLQLEITRSRMGARDLTQVFAKVKALGGRAFGLSSFLIILHERHVSREKQRKESPGNHPHPRTQRALASADRADQATHHMETLVPLMREATADLRSAANEGLSGAMKWMTEINHSRWKKPKGGWSDVSIRETNLANLKTALAEFRASKHFAVLEPFRSVFDDEGRLKPEMGRGSQLHGDLAYSAQDLFRCYVFTTSLVYFCDVLVELMEMLLDIERRNPGNKIQLPNKFAKKLVESANSSEGGGNPLDTGSKQVGHEEDDAQSQDTLVDEEKGAPARMKHRPRDPDARTPHNGFQKTVGIFLHKTWKVLSSSAGVFALKQGLASMAIYALAVAPQTAGFFYQNRGLWALIMSQTGMGVYTGEQIGGFFLRFGGTVAGLVVGMVAWYVGAGSGPGNPYGIAASTMVFIAPFMWGRCHAPQAQMVFPLMTGVTMMLVVGYGWVDEHIYQTANQGSGAGLAGRRALLVLIGFAVAFIIMLFPKPISAKVLVRRTLAKNLSDLGDLYGVMIGAMEDEAAAEDRRAEDLGRSRDEKAARDVDTRQARYRDRFLGCASRLMSLQPSMQFASLEPGLKGPWPKEEYHELLQYQYQLISSLALLSGATARLDQKWIKAVDERVPLMHPAFVADALTLFALLHQALAHGGPLPPTMPIFERLAYHSTRQRPQGRSSGRNVSDRAGGSASADRSRTDVTADDPIPDDDASVDSASQIWQEEQNVILRMEDQLSWKTVQDEQFAIFATVNVALIHTVGALNEIHRVVLSLVGEKELSGFDRAQERWGQKEAESAAF